MIEYALAGVLGNINQKFDNANLLTFEVTKTATELAGRLTTCRADCPGTIRRG